MTAADALDGWLALFDGETTFGWSDAEVKDGRLIRGRTTSVFGNCELKGEATAAGTILFGVQSLEIPAGKFKKTIELTSACEMRLGAGISFRTLWLKPAGLKSVFNGRDLSGWTVLKHPKLPAERQAKWSIAEGALRATGGPGAVEYEERHGQIVLQVEARTRGTLVNGGVFFRSIPGQFMNGYEAQLFNACYDHDPTKPARYSTGAIDDRQLARKLVSRDLEPLTMTVIAVGPHIATWVNGWQMTDWTDTRDRHENPRQGLRLEPGTIQLQAHDPETDIEFRRVLIAELK